LVLAFVVFGHNAYCAYEQNTTLLNRWIYGAATAVEIDPPYAYVGIKAWHACAINVLDLSDQDHVRTTAQIMIPKMERDTVDMYHKLVDIKLRGDLLYVLDENTGLSILDVSSPENPFLLGHYPMIGPLRCIEIVDTVAYILRFTGGFHLINVANPSNIRNIGFFLIDSELLDLKASNSHLYVAAEDSGLISINIANLTVPRALDTLQVYSSAFAVEVLDSMAYVAATYGGVRVIDISHPESMEEVGSCSWMSGRDSCYAMEIRIDDGLAAIQDGNDLKFLDLVNPVRPSIIGGIDRSLYDLRDFQFRNGDAVFLARNDDGFFSYDVTDLDHPQLKSRFRTHGDMLSLSIKDEFILLKRFFERDSITRLDLLGFDDEYRLKELNYLEFDGVVRSVTQRDNLLFISVAEADSVRVYEFADNGDLTEYGRTFVCIGNANLYDFGQLVCAVSSFGILLFNFEDPLHPELLGTIDEHNIRSLDVSDTLLIITQTISNIKSYSIADPTAPRLLDVMEIAGGWANVRLSINLDESRGYLVHGINSLSILDVTNPSDLSIIQTIDFNESLGQIEVNDDYLYISNYYNRRLSRYGGLRIWSVADPDTTFEIGYYSVIDAYGSGVQEGIIALLGESGIYLIGNNEYPWSVHEDRPFLPNNGLVCYPNPANSRLTCRFSSDAPGILKLSIHDVTGRSCGEVQKVVDQAGEHQFDYGVDELANGVYVVHAEMGSLTFMSKVVILK